METQAVEKHLLTEDVHVFDGDEQGGHRGSYDGTDTRQKHRDSLSQLRHLDTFIPRDCEIKYLSLRSR